MTDLIERRKMLADLIADAVGSDVPVYAAAPTNITPPCVLVMTGAAVGQARRGHWDAESRVIVIAPPGDSQAGADILDDLLLTVALTLSDGVGVPVLWDEPSARTFAGGTFLAAEFKVQTRVTVSEVVTPYGR